MSHEFVQLVHFQDPMTRTTRLVESHVTPSIVARSGHRAAVVRLSPPNRSDEEILRALSAGEVWAAAALLDRYGIDVERILRHILGDDPELEDLVHDAFASILGSAANVRDSKALRAWIVSVAAHTAHRAIRKRKLTRWIFFWQGETLPDVPHEMDLAGREALRRTYAILDQLPANERIAFALRHIEEMPLDDVAQACEVSLATIKRRLNAAEQRFTAMARRDPVLRSWLEEGQRFT